MHEEPYLDSVDEMAEAIAIVGMAGRFPGARNVEELWCNLRDGVEGITAFQDEDLAAAGVEPALLENPRYVKARGVLDGVENFDPEFFGISRREAELTDPQHRLFLECCWQALEDAGRGAGIEAPSIGVFAGSLLSTYLLSNLLPQGDRMEAMDLWQAGVLNQNDSLCTRVSYRLNLKGPSVAVQTACSTSLVAVHMACQSLLSYQCDAALAGGVSIRSPQRTGYLYVPEGIFSPDGHCRAFDRRGQGTVFGNGVGVVVLRRLEDALEDGDDIRAVIRGSAINNDGSLKVGFTAPSVNGQAEVVARALALAEFDPASISYVEAHGTGTALGDPIEVAALTRAFGGPGGPRGTCALGTIKSNLGHLDAAAGIAGLIKTVLAMRHRQLPPSLHFEEPNPEIDFEKSPFRVVTELQEWAGNGGSLRAGVSAFGIGGTNAHVLLEEAPTTPPPAVSRPWQVVELSARTPKALETLGESFADHLAEHPEQNLADVAFTARVGRRSFPHRQAILCRGVKEAQRALDEGTPELLAMGHFEGDRRPVAFLFPGQGVQHPAMGRQLYAEEEVFRREVDRCAEHLVEHLGFDLRESLFKGSGADAARLTHTDLAQPALFVVEYALAQLWMSWGIQPAAMLGHSVGEVVAACLSGVFTLPQALELIALRGRLMQEMPPGAMLALPLGEEELLPLLDVELEVAVVNEPQRVVVSGTVEAIEGLEQRLRERSLEGRRLHTSHAFHSALVEPAVAPLVERIRALGPKEPTIPFLSNVTGTWITAEEATDPEYWGRHLRSTVRFADGVKELLQEPDQVLLEVGPGTTLCRSARRHPECGAERILVASMPRPDEANEELRTLFGAVAQMWVAGVELDAKSFYGAEYRRRIPLPTYPFERQRCWIDPVAGVRWGKPAKTAGSTDQVYLPTWRQAVASPPWRPSGEGEWWIFEGSEGLSQQLGEHLRAAGETVLRAVSGPRFDDLGDGRYVLASDRREDFARLLELESDSESPLWVLYCWDLEADDEAGRRAQAPAFLAEALAQSLAAKGSREVSLVLLTRKLFRIGSGDGVDPERARLFGYTQYLSTQYPALSVRLVDIGPGAAEDAQVERLLSEMEAPNSTTAAAWRGDQRWILESTRQPLAGVEGEDLLRRGGTYLVGGAFDGSGGTIARYLAQEAQAKVVLLEDSSRRGLPELDAKTLAQTRRVEEELEEELGIRHFTAYEGLMDGANRLCTGYLYDYLTRGLDSEGGLTVSRQALRQRLRIQPVAERFFDWMIRTLVTEGRIKRQGETLTFVPANGVEDLAGLSAELQERFPEFRDFVEFLDHCVSHYPEALSGDISSLSVLYPEGSSRLVDGVYQSTEAFRHSKLYHLLLRDVLSRLADRSEGRRLKILEIGAGNGFLTNNLAPALAGHEVEYHFTDLGRSFVLEGERRAEEYGIKEMRFGVLDIAQDPVPQGFPRGDFDIIVGLNVVHVTPQVADTLAHLKTLLAPNGAMLLIETTISHRWDQMTWGLLEGWWGFEDELRTDSPLLSAEGWHGVLRQVGFENVRVFPQEEERRAAIDFGLLIAQQTVPATARGTDLVDEIAALGGEGLRLAVDLHGDDALHKALSPVEERFGVLHGAFYALDGPGEGRAGLAELQSFDELLGERGLEFVLTLSSLSSWAGAAEPAACLEAAEAGAWARARSLAGRPTAAVFWNLQAEGPGVGGVESLKPEQAMAALGRVAKGCLWPEVAFSAMALPEWLMQLAAERAQIVREPAPTPVVETVIVAPEGPLEEAIAEIFRTRLGAQTIGAEDNFFHLGGDSLIALQILSRLEQLFPVGLEVQDLFEHPTVRGLAEEIEERLTLKLEALPDSEAEALMSQLFNPQM